MTFVNFKLGLVRVQPANDIPGRLSGINLRELDAALNNIQPEGDPGGRSPELPPQNQEASRQHCVNVQHIISVTKDEQKCIIRVHTVVHSIDVQYLTMESLMTEWKIILAAMPDKFLVNPNLILTCNHIIYIGKQPVYVNDVKKYAVQFVTTRSDANFCLFFEMEDEQKKIYDDFSSQLKIN